MNVQELIKVLEELPPDSLVCCSSDDEGNSISAVYEVSTYKGLEDGRYYDIVAEEDAPYYEDDGLIDIVVIWP
jgi:hypothetical protein